MTFIARRSGDLYVELRIHRRCVCEQEEEGTVAYSGKRCGKLLRSAYISKPVKYIVEKRKKEQLR